MLIYYKDFIAEIEYISRVGCFYGEVINNNCFIFFQTEYKYDLDAVFKIAVEQYLQYKTKSQVLTNNLNKSIKELIIT